MLIKSVEKEDLATVNSSVFLSSKWLYILRENEVPYGIFDNNGQLIGGFVLSKEKLFGLNFYRPPRLMSTISLFYKNSAKNYSKHIGEEKKLMQLLLNFFNELPYHIITLYFPTEFRDMQPFIWNKYKVIPSYTYIINLSNSIEEIEGKFSPERRNDIKKAIKDGVVCKHEHKPEIVKQLVLNTFSRKQKIIDSRLFDKLLFEFADSNNSVTYISYLNDRPIAAVFCIYDNSKIYYILGGYDNSYKHQGAGAIAVYSAIKYAKEIGIKHFDFEGSMLPEVEKYFRGFGGNLTPYYSINKAKLPLEIVLKFFKRSVF